MQLGGLGDLVLTSDLVASLKRAWPHAHITLACRTRLRGILPLYPVQPDEVLGIELDLCSWVTPSEALLDELRPVLRLLENRGPHLYIAADFQPTWFSWFAGAVLQPKRAVACSGVQRPRGLLTYVLEKLQLPSFDWEGPAYLSTMHERDRYCEISRFLGLAADPSPRWVLPPEVSAATGEMLAELGLESKRYLVFFPCGSPSATLKRWPADRFVDVLRDIEAEMPLGVLLTGAHDEAEELRAMAARLSGQGGKIVVWTGDDLSLLAGLMAQSRCYLGNDTGPMHLAAAYDVPGVAIYGGGYWPAYAPWGAGSLGMVHPLPCFQCDWQCLFGHAVCVESITTSAVRDALRQVLRAPTAPPEIVTLETLSPETLRLIADANQTYRKAQNDASERFNTMLESQHLSGERRQMTVGRRSPVPSISVIVLAPKPAAFLTETIESILRQDYPGLEIVVAAGSSGDKYGEVRDAYQSRLTWLDEPHLSPLEATKGEIVGWVPAGCLLLAGTIQKVADSFAENPALGSLYGPGYQVDREDRLQPTESSPCGFLRRSALEAFEKAGRNWIDVDLLGRLADAFPVTYHEEPLFCTRQSQGPGWVGLLKSLLSRQ